MDEDGLYKGKQECIAILKNAGQIRQQALVKVETPTVSPVVSPAVKQEKVPYNAGANVVCFSSIDGLWHDAKVVSVSDQVLQVQFGDGLQEPRDIGLVLPIWKPEDKLQLLQDGAWVPATAKNIADSVVTVEVEDGVCVNAPFTLLRPIPPMQTVREPELFCVLCKADFDDAEHAQSLLPCGHTMCANCVKYGECQYAIDDGLFCGAKFDASDAIIGNRPERAVFCSECDAPTASFCTVCKEHLCEFHTDNHQRSRRTKDHTLEKLIVPNKCSLHLNQEILGVCTACVEVVCTDCIVQSHGTHTVPTTLNALRILNDNLQSEKARKLAAVTSLIGQADTTISELVDHKAETTARINEVIDALATGLQTMKSSLLNASALSLNAQIKSTSEVRDNLLVQRERMNQSSASIDSSVADASMLSKAIVRLLAHKNQHPIPPSIPVKQSVVYTGDLAKAQCLLKQIEAEVGRLQQQR